jgi:DNA-binding transcriptional ArsR family regulator
VTEIPHDHPLPDEVVELIARRLRVIADPTRIKLLDRLRANEATVQELTDAVGSTQQNVSKHLGVLIDAGIVARRRYGSFMRYRVVDESVYRLCEEVCGSIARQVDDLQALLATASRQERSADVSRRV